MVIYTIVYRLFGPPEFVVLGCISGQPLLGLGGDPVLTARVYLHTNRPSSKCDLVTRIPALPIVPHFINYPNNAHVGASFKEIVESPPHSSAAPNLSPPRMRSTDVLRIHLELDLVLRKRVHGKIHVHSRERRVDHQQGV